MPNSRYIFDLHEGVWAYSRRPFGTITSAATTSTEDATNTNIDDGDDENSKANSKIPPISILLTELPASATLGLPMEPKQLDIDLRFKEIIMDVSQNLLILFVSSRP